MTLPSPRPSNSNQTPPSHQPDPVAAGRRSRAFPDFQPEHLAELVNRCVLVYNAALNGNHPTLAAVAYELAMHDRCRRGFLRWCWTGRHQVLSSNFGRLPEVLLAWHAAGKPDGIDCCLQCASPAWCVNIEDEYVLTAVGGTLKTGNKIAFGRRSTCHHGTLIDVLA